MSFKSYITNNEDFRKELKEKNKKAYYELEQLSEFESFRKKILFNSKYGKVLLNPRTLLKGNCWDINSAIDKHSYFVGLLKEKNANAYKNLEFITEYVNMGAHIIAKDMFGELRVNPNSLLHGCTPDSRSAIDKNIYFRNKVFALNPNVLKKIEIVSDFKTNNSKILIKDKYGEMKIKSSHLFSHSEFGIESAVDKTSYWINMVKDKRLDKGSVYNYSNVEYIDTKTKVCIICKKHGEFMQFPSYHLSGHGCPRCNNSKAEEKISSILKDNNIKFIDQYKFEDCKNIFSLPFDFYLPDYNIAIEADGFQHIEPIEVFGGKAGFVKRKKK